VGSNVGQHNGDSSGWRFEGQGAVKADTISHEIDALTVCWLKAA
jgi:hypothetical protein